MSDEKCPVCGKGEHEFATDAYGRPIPDDVIPVSHRDCVLAKDIECDEWAEKWIEERKARWEAEAEVERMRNLLLMAHADAWTNDTNFYLTVDEWLADLARRYEGAHCEGA